MFLRLLFLSLVLIIIGQTPLITPVRGMVAKVANPLQYGAYKFSKDLKSELEFFLNLRRLREENLKLEVEILGLESQLSSQKETGRENELLRAQLGFSENTGSQELILVKIVGRSARGGEAMLTINQGMGAGVREGAAVIFKNFLLGEVFQVEPRRAKIRLLTDSQFSAAALDQDSPARTRGLLTGQYGTTVVLQKVLPVEPLVVGDVVVTSGEDGKFEKGLVLGRVKKIGGQEADVFKTAELELMVDFEALEEVFVIK